MKALLVWLIDFLLTEIIFSSAFVLLKKWIYIQISVGENNASL